MSIRILRHPKLAAIDNDAVVNSQQNVATRQGGSSLAAAGPDLVIGDVEINNDSIDIFELYGTVFTPGDSFDLEWDVDNVGDDTAGNSTTEVWLVAPDNSHIVLDTNTVPDLDADDSEINETESCKIPVGTAPGTYQIYVFADAGRVVTEGDDTNNIYYFRIEVGEAAVPDLIIEDLQVNGDSVSNGGTLSAVFHPGDQISLNWDVRNDGEGDASSSNATVRFVTPGGELVVGGESTSSLNAGDTDTNESFTYALPPDLEPGEYRLIVEADGDHAFSEASDTNNEYGFTFSVANYVDTVWEGIDTTATLGVGGDVEGRIDQDGINGVTASIDKDWYKVTLEAGHSYTFNATSGVSSIDGLDEVAIRVYSGNNTTATDRAEGASPSLTYEVAIGGDYWIAISAGGSSFESKIGQYRIDLVDNGVVAGIDAVNEGTDTGATLAVNSQVEGSIDQDGRDEQIAGIDKDWYRVTLEAGHAYTFAGDAGLSGTDTLDSMAIRIYSDASTTASGRVEGGAPSITFTPESAGDYWVAVSAGGTGFENKTGAFRLTLTDNGTPPPGADDFADDAADGTFPIGVVNVGGSRTGNIGEADANDTNGDKDVFKVHLEQGQTYTFNLVSTSVGGPALSSGIFTVRHPNDFDDTRLTSAVGSDVSRALTLDETGDYYIRVGSGGAVTDQGGYRLSVTNITPPPGTADDYPDDPGDTGANNPIKVMATAGGAATGRIEVSGDKDVFRVSLVEGHTYQFSVTGENLSGGELSNLYMSLRDGTNFAARNDEGGGIGQATITYVAQRTGDEYVRIGAGGEGTGTGGYRVSVSEKGIVAPVEEPSTDDNKVEAISQWIDNRVYELTNLTFSFEEHKFALLKELYEGVQFEDTRKVLQKISDAFKPLGFIVDVGAYIDRVSNAPDKAEALYIESFKIIWGVIASFGGKFGGGLIGLLSGGNPIIGAIIGEFAADVLYSLYLEGKVEQYYDLKWDGIDDYATGSIFAQINAEAQSDGGVDLDEGQLVQFDEAYYLATYADAASAVANGTVGSALAHFLTIGIDKGHRPNDSQQLARSELAVAIINNDPAALGNAALFTGALGAYAGDGISTAENAVAAAINAARPTGTELALDRRLSAIANRKATDLVANAIDSAAGEALAKGSSAWAEAWSNGNLFAQQFNGAFSTIVGVANLQDGLRMIVVASSATDPAGILALLRQQNVGALGDADFDTIGIAEHGGLWVVILADRQPGYAIQAPGADSLLSTTQYGGIGDDVLFAGARQATLYGLEGKDRLAGGSGDDSLDGGAGADTLSGGAGNDSYVNPLADVIVEGAGQGIDTVFSNLAFSLAALANVENLTLTGVANTAATGNALANLILGNAGANRIDGGAGVDTLRGGTGNDTYVNPGADVIGELANEGVDTVESNASFSLAAIANVDRLTLTGGANVNATGNALANLILGNAGANRIDGGGGVDTLKGGAGNDTYVNPGADVIGELGGEGTDTVESNNTFSLAATGNVERLILTGAGNIAGAGNALANLILGNAGANRIDGAGGTDTLKGGAGNDTYVNPGADVIVELVNEGTDTVESKTSFSLATTGHVERLILTGAAGVNGTGNALANLILGNAGANVLDGGGGVDTLKGGAGDDTYINPGTDVVGELAGGGFDTVMSNATHSLAITGNVERLVLAGAGNIAGTGNSLDNRIEGNQGRNLLDGGSGRDLLNSGAADDTLVGGAGNDTLAGGSGNDLFRFGASAGNDTITDFGLSADRFDLGGRLFTGISVGADYTRLVYAGGSIAILGVTELTLAGWNDLIIH